jgi:endonuclease/exonuclease/phosphatase family metal-dependent hydrolase
MKMPYVGRSTHDRVVDALERRVEMADHNLQEMHRLHELERRRYDELLALYHQLRGAGASVPTVASEPSVVDEAIDQKVRQFGNSTRLRRVLQDFARKEAMRNGEPEAIAEKILDWRDKAAGGEE